MTTVSTLITGGVLGALGMVVVGVINAVVSSRRDRGEADDRRQAALRADAAQSGTSWVSLVTSLQAQVTRQDTRLDQQDERIERLESEVSRIRARYAHAIEYVRVLRRWAHERHAGQVPAPPIDIADDI